MPASSDGEGSFVAQRVVVQMTDDIDGKPAVETVTFGLDGRVLEIDLSEKNAKALRKAFEPWITSARRVSRRKPRAGRSTSPGPGSQGVDPKLVRAWAASNGYDISPRGRIASEVIESYLAAGN